MTCQNYCQNIMGRRVDGGVGKSGGGNWGNSLSNYALCMPASRERYEIERKGQGREGVNGFQMGVQMGLDRLTVSIGSTINCLSSGILIELSALSKNVKCQM